MTGTTGIDGFTVSNTRLGAHVPLEDGVQGELIPYLKKASSDRTPLSQSAPAQPTANTQKPSALSDSDALLEQHKEFILAQLSVDDIAGGYLACPLAIAKEWHLANFKAMERALPTQGPATLTQKALYAKAELYRMQVGLIVNNVALTKEEKISALTALTRNEELSGFSPNRRTSDKPVENIKSLFAKVNFVLDCGRLFTDAELQYAFDKLTLGTLEVLPESSIMEAPASPAPAPVHTPMFAAYAPSPARRVTLAPLTVSKYELFKKNRLDRALADVAPAKDFSLNNIYVKLAERPVVFRKYGGAPCPVEFVKWFSANAPAVTLQVNKTHSQEILLGNAESCFREVKTIANDASLTPGEKQAKLKELTDTSAPLTRNLPEIAVLDTEHDDGFAAMQTLCARITVTFRHHSALCSASEIEGVFTKQMVAPSKMEPIEDVSGWEALPLGYPEAPAWLTAVPISVASDDRVRPHSFVRLIGEMPFSNSAKAILIQKFEGLSEEIQAELFELAEPYLAPGQNEEAIIAASKKALKHFYSSLGAGVAAAPASAPAAVADLSDTEITSIASPFASLTADYNQFIAASRAWAFAPGSDSGNENTIQRAARPTVFDGRYEGNPDTLEFAEWYVGNREPATLPLNFAAGTQKTLLDNVQRCLTEMKRIVSDVSLSDAEKRTALAEFTATSAQLSMDVSDLLVYEMPGASDFENMQSFCARADFVNAFACGLAVPAIADGFERLTFEPPAFKSLVSILLEGKEEVTILEVYDHIPLEGQDELNKLAMKYAVPGQSEENQAELVRIAFELVEKYLGGPVAPGSEIEALDSAMATDSMSETSDASEETGFVALLNDLRGENAIAEETFSLFSSEVRDELNLLANACFAATGRDEEVARLTEALERYELRLTELTVGSDLQEVQDGFTEIALEAAPRSPSSGWVKIKEYIRSVRNIEVISQDGEKSPMGSLTSSEAQETFKGSPLAGHHVAGPASSTSVETGFLRLLKEAGGAEGQRSISQSSIKAFNSLSGKIRKELDQIAKISFSATGMAREVMFEQALARYARELESAKLGPHIENPSSVETVSRFSAGEGKGFIDLLRTAGGAKEADSVIAFSALPDAAKKTLNNMAKHTFASEGPVRKVLLKYVLKRYTFYLERVEGRLKIENARKGAIETSKKTGLPEAPRVRKPFTPMASIPELTENKSVSSEPALEVNKFSERRGSTTSTGSADSGIENLMESWPDSDDELFGPSSIVSDVDSGFSGDEVETSAKLARNTGREFAKLAIDLTRALHKRQEEKATTRANAFPMPPVTPGDALQSLMAKKGTSTPSDFVIDMPTSAPSEVVIEMPTSAPLDFVIEMPTSAPLDFVIDMPTNTPPDFVIDMPTNMPSEVVIDMPEDKSASASSDVVIGLKRKKTRIEDAKRPRGMPAQSGPNSAIGNTARPQLWSERYQEGIAAQDRAAATGGSKEIPSLEMLEARLARLRNRIEASKAPKIEATPVSLKSTKLQEAASVPVAETTSVPVGSEFKPVPLPRRKRLEAAPVQEIEAKTEAAAVAPKQRPPITPRRAATIAEIEFKPVPRARSKPQEAAGVQKTEAISAMRSNAWVQIGHDKWVRADHADAWKAEAFAAKPAVSLTSNLRKHSREADMLERQQQRLRKSRPDFNRSTSDQATLNPPAFSKKRPAAAAKTSVENSAQSTEIIQPRTVSRLIDFWENR